MITSRFGHVPPVPRRSLFLPLLTLALIWGGLVMASPIQLSAAAPEEAAPRAWFFTGRDTLTLDVKIPSGAVPDWAKSVLTLTPSSGSAGGQSFPITADRLAPVTEPGLQRIRFTHLNVEAWWPQHPMLYVASLKVVNAGGAVTSVARRIGFRSFSTEHAQLLLNGRPIFLRGFAINPPGRGIPPELETSRKFAEDYIHYLKSLHINIIRIPDDPTWYDVCDELGMMVFGGNYSGKVAGHGPDADAAAAANWFREEKFYPLANHPSLMIYALTNETPFGGELGARWTGYLGEIYQNLQAWDPTRLYIGNAGYGFGKVGEIDDLHRYWGWYYESPFTYLHLRDYDGLMLPGKNQPLTFTESVGNYNGPDGRVNLTPHHKNPLAQLNWTGTAPTAEQGLLEFEHQSLTIREATELFRRLRPINPKLAGVFPFTILFNYWNTIGSFSDMDPKPAARQLAASYSPVLLSWELFTTQVYAGITLHPIAHVVNDSDEGVAVTPVLEYEVRDATARTVASGQVAVATVSYYGTARQPLAIPLPDSLATGEYTLWGQLSDHGKVIAENHVALFIAAKSFAATGQPISPLRLYDPTGKTGKALRKLGVKFSPFDFGTPSQGNSTIVVAEGVVGKVNAAQAKELQDFAQGGGRVLILRQDPADVAALARVLPVAFRMPATSIDDPKYPPPPRPSRDSFNANPERSGHPVFAGLDRRRLQIWSDPAEWNEERPGLPRIYPVDGGIVLTDQAAVRTTAVLADYSQDLEGVALAECFTGSGSILYSAFDLVAKVGYDPVADRLLNNLLGYLSKAEGHEAQVLIEAPIEWGKYETEHGVLLGCYSGLMLNSRPALNGSDRGMKITITKAGDEFAGGTEAWNSRPGIVYRPFGRRPFGPYLHSGWSGVAEPENPDSPEGEGRFWCRLPTDKNQVVHRFFNPADVALVASAEVNGHRSSQSIPPGETGAVRVQFPAGMPVIENVLRGDRRLVVLETDFTAQSSVDAGSPSARGADLVLIHQVADWELAHPDVRQLPTNWIEGAFYTGLMATARLPGGDKYREAMHKIADGNQWLLGPLPYHADDHCVGQAYAEMYELDHDPRMIADLKKRFDYILAHPSEGSLDFDKNLNPTRLERWSWCDALFMAPPAWIRLGAVTGDQRYRDYMVRHWEETSAYLYDANEHLFYRDSTFFLKREANGKKVFWSRGNGWVLAGLARVLTVLTPDDPARRQFEKQFQEMSERLLALQQPDGFWRTSLLDPDSYPQAEASGTGFYCFGLAWGVNHGLLSREKYWPAVEKAWASLKSCVTPEGQLVHVQAVAGAPKQFPPNTSMPYAVGAFLLAGKEMYEHAP